MNIELIQAIARFKENPCDMNREEVLKLMNAADITNSPLSPILSDEILLDGIKILALSYLEWAIKELRKGGGWDELVMGAQLSEGLQKINENPGLMPFTQAILMIAFAIINRKENHV